MQKPEKRGDMSQQKMPMMFDAETRDSPERDARKGLH
jgi:hypothetical protein